MSILFSIFSCGNEAKDTCVFQIGKKDLFVKSINWGINGNSRLVTISSNNTPLNHNHIDAKNEFAYIGDFPIFLKIAKDTLYIFTYKLCQIPRNFKSDCYIKQIEIGNEENMKIMNDTNYVDVDKMCVK